MASNKALPGTEPPAAPPTNVANDLVGHSDSGGIGLLGDGVIGARLAGSRAGIYLGGGTGATPLGRVDAHKVGEIDIDSNTVCGCASSRARQEPGAS